MSRLVLGINSAHGDSSAALVGEEGLIAAIAEERINRKKHCAGFPSRAVAEVLRSGRLASGDRVAELEERWAAHLGTRHAIGVANPTVALMTIYAGLGLGPGDEVITVSHTFDATVSAILSTGATPVFVDIEPDTYRLDA